MANTSVTVDGTRFVLVAGGLLAIAAGVLAFRKMDDGLAVPIWADLKSALRGDSAKRRRMAGGGMFIAFEGGEGVRQVDPNRDSSPPHCVTSASRCGHAGTRRYQCRSPDPRLVA